MCNDCSVLRSNSDWRPFLLLPHPSFYTFQTFPIMHLPSKKLCCCSPCHTHLFKKKNPQPWQRWIDVLICLFNRRFPLQLPSCLSLVLLQWGRGRACIFMVINTCTQSFNLPYLSHVTVWLHCLIWVSFNLSRPRLEINEGRKRHIWVSYSVEGYKGWDELETNVVHLTVLSLFSTFPWSPSSVSLHLSLSVSLSLSLSSLV